MKKRKLIGNKSNKKAVTEVLGTLLLLGISVSLFSIVYLSVLTTPSNPHSPSVNIGCTFDENNIILSHLGGKDLSLDTKVLFTFNDGSTDEIIINDYMTSEYKVDEKWGLGEKVVYSSSSLIGNQVEVAVVDVKSNSIVMIASVPPVNPIITFVNNLAYLQTESTISISATSSGVNPDNVSLWYYWNGLWEDNFDDNDTNVSSYHNMSFSSGDYVTVNQSGIGSDIEDYVDDNTGNVDGSLDNGVHSNFENEKTKDTTYDTLTEGNTNLGSEDYVDSDTSNVDSSTDKGTHGNFNNQKTLDGSFDTLTEENTAGGGSTTTLIDDDFEGANNWNTDWDIVTTYSVSPTHSIECDRYENDLISSDLNTAGASSITISFKYRIDDIDGSDNINVYYYDGNYYDAIEEIGDDQEDTWLTYSDTIYNSGGDAQYFVNDFRLAIDGSSIDNGEHLWVDDVLIQKEIIVENYEIDLEVQWTNIDYDETYEELCIYAGTMGSEDIIVDAWNGVSWETVFSDLSTGWNNASITTWLTSSTFTIRYKGGTETTDTNQDTWQIDATLIHVWTPSGDIYYEGNITSITITKPSNSDWSMFYADVNNRANSTFSILNAAGNPLLENLDGTGNNISNDVTVNTIRLFGEFNYSVTLDSWNVTIDGEDWNIYSTDTSSPWSWNFDFEDNNGFILFYWFYSIGKKSGWPDENTPEGLGYDTRCKYQP